MTDTLLQVTELSELDLDAVPLCEVLFRNPVTHHEFKCGKPSVVRARLNCPDCGRVRILFLCARCYHDLMQQRLRCWYCVKNGATAGHITSYTEV